MTANFAAMSDADLLRAAIHETREAAREHHWDAYTLDFALGQMYTGTVRGNDELEKVWSSETAPTQARLDLHLTEGSVEGHTAPAESFARLVAGLSDATKEISKKKLDRKSYSSPLLVRGAGTGSVRLVVEIVPHENDDRDGSMGELSTVDSDSLRRIAAILGSSDDMSDDSTLTAQIRPLPTKARTALKRVARQIARQHWHVEGVVEQRGFRPADIGISPQGARRLEVELTHADIDPKPVTLYGGVDGTIDIERIVWFHPEGGKRFRASAVDDEVAAAALALQPDHPRVKAEFVVYESLGEGDDVVKRSWELQSIEAAPAERIGAQGTL